jgi:hypothetical protein
LGLRGVGANAIGARLGLHRRRVATVKPVAAPARNLAHREDADPGRMSAALRQQRHRQRARDGRIVLQVELPKAELIELLITAALLNPHADFYSREDLAEGVTRFLELSRNA